MIVIPHTSLSGEALQGLIEAFVLREGTDYGHADYTLQQKHDSVMAALQGGRAQIHYDPESEHFEIVLNT